MRIAMISIGSTGDVKPYLLLGRELKKRGHEITLCAFKNFQEDAESEGFHFAPINRDARDFMKQVLGGNKGGLDYLKNATGEVSILAGALLDAVDSCVQECDIAISSFFAGLGAKICGKYNKKFVQTHYYPMDTNELAPISSAKGFMFGPAYFRLSYKLGYLVINMIEKYYVNKFKEQYDLESTKIKTSPVYEINGKKFPVIYAISKYVFPQYEKWDDNIHVAGYFMDKSPVHYVPDPALMQFINNGDPPVYIGFGSMVSDKLHKYLSMTIKACQNVGVRAIVVQGWKNLEDKNYDNVYFAEAMPHSFIFQHVQAVIHHGGAGTFAAGISHGKPTMVVPFGGDQPFSAYRAHQLGIGPKPLITELISIYTLSEKIKDLVDNEDYKINALALAEQMNKENGVVTAADIIEEYMYADEPASQTE